MNLRELSDLLGLSPTTVSRALNNYPEVSEATRARVKRVAEEQHYRPNARAMSLATGRAMTIGHVIPLFSQNEIVNPVFGEFIAGASQTYTHNGYELLLTVASGDNEESTYRQFAASGAVDGVIVHSPQRDDGRVALLQKIGLPFVMHGRVSACKTPYSWVDINNRRAFGQATKLLIDLGHRQIALINGQETLNFAWSRRLGYTGALQEANLPVVDALISATQMTESNGYHCAKSMLSSQNPPTAFMVSAYVAALGVRRAINEAGLVLGEDISVIIHDDELSYFHNDGDVPQFTATRSSVRQAGARAAQMLLDIIDNPASAPVTQLLDAHLIIGLSTGPVKNT